MAQRASNDQPLLEALGHPLRRRLLRRYVEAGGELSPIELAHLENEPLSNVSYHVRVLRDKGALEVAGSRAVRGSLQHFYRPAELVTATPWVLATLGLEG